MCDKICDHYVLGCHHGKLKLPTVPTYREKRAQSGEIKIITTEGCWCYIDGHEDGRYDASQADEFLAEGGTPVECVCDWFIEVEVRDRR